MNLLSPRRARGAITTVSALALLCVISHAAEPATFPGTQPLTITGDLSTQMHHAALRDMDAKIADAPRTRAQFWHRDTSSPEAYARSVAPNREHFQQIIGLVDPRVPVVMERFGDDANHAQ